jgi:hypothetical protein
VCCQQGKAGVSPADILRCQSIGNSFGRCLELPPAVRYSRSPLESVATVDMGLLLLAAG